MRLGLPGRWRGVDQVYTLPWMWRRIELSADPARIRAFARRPFTRSRMLMNLLSQFHLSRHSIVVSDDAHAAALRPLLLRCLPDRAAYAGLAEDLVRRIAAAAQDGAIAPLDGVVVRETYLTLLDALLGIDLPPALESSIRAESLAPGWRPLRTEAIMFSLGLHAPAFAPLRWALETLVFREPYRMRGVARRLARAIRRDAAPRPGSWYAELLRLNAEGRLSTAQLLGEITAVQVAAFSLSAALASTLFCLAADPREPGRIAADPDRARFFVMEVLRLFPPFQQFGYVAAARARRPGDPDEFLVSALFLHRDARGWTDPGAFDPDRFRRGDPTAACSYLPFGVGRRVCPGRSLAMALLVEATRFLCSPACPIRLAPTGRYPTPRVDRVISFPRENRLAVVPR